jgi:hypothetical protein
VHEKIAYTTLVVPLILKLRGAICVVCYLVDNYVVVCSLIFSFLQDGYNIFQEANANLLLTHILLNVAQLEIIITWYSNFSKHNWEHLEGGE